MQQLIIIMEGSKTLFCISKFPSAHNKNAWKVYRQFGHVPSKRFAGTVLYETEFPQHSYGQRNTTQDIQFNTPNGRMTQLIFKLCL